MNIIRNIILLCKDIVNSNRVTVFFLLLAGYYIVNLITSPLNLGMSGGLEAEHNIYNQATAGVLVVYMSFFCIFSQSRHANLLVSVTFMFLLYVVLNTYLRYTFDEHQHSIFYFTDIFYLCYWGGGLIFSMKCFRYISAYSLNRLMQMLVLVCLVFFTYRLFTQKEILNQQGILAGINAVAHAFMLIPLILLAFKGRNQILLFLFCAFICIYSAKRQAAIGLAIMTIFSFKILIQTYFKRYKFVAFLVLSIIIYFGRDYVPLVFYDLNYRQEQIEAEDNSEVDSGRKVLWNTALVGYQYSDDQTKWFGGGPGTAQNYIGSFSLIARAPHNGFIQILCDFGALGLILYILFFMVLLGYVVKVKGLDNKLIYLSIVLSWVFVNVISHPGSLSFIFLAIGIGYIFYKQENETNRIYR